VAVCTGLNRCDKSPYCALTRCSLSVPNVPVLPGREIFQGTILHSREYRNAKVSKVSIAFVNVA
jgi:hypothetical protein